MRGYYQYIGQDAAIKVGHTFQDLVVSCRILTLDGLTLGSIPCGDLIQHRLVVFSENFNCYSLKIPVWQEKYFPIGLSLILYLDNLNPMQRQTQVIPQVKDTSNSGGAFIMVMEPNITISPILQGTALTPGTDTTVIFSPEQVKRLPPPYGTCADESHKHLQQLWFDGQPVKYSEIGCVGQCQQSAVMENCQCKDAALLQVCNDTDKELLTSLPFCLNIHLQREMLIDNMTCALIARKKYWKYCTKSCPIGCANTYYHTKSSAFQWPEVNNPKSFVEKMLTRNRSPGLLNLHHAITRNLGQNNTTIDHKDHITATTIVNRNLLKVNVRVGDYTYIKMEDVVSLTSSQLLSQLGGIFNLCCGISMCLFVEILELIFTILTGCLGDNKKNKVKVETNS